MYTHVHRNRRIAVHAIDRERKPLSSHDPARPCVRESNDLTVASRELNFARADLAFTTPSDGLISEKSVLCVINKRLFGTVRFID